MKTLILKFQSPIEIVIFLWCVYLTTIGTDVSEIGGRFDSEGIPAI